MSRNDLKKAVRGDLSSFHMPCSAQDASSFRVPIPSPSVILVTITYMLSCSMPERVFVFNQHI